jgi:hypothetical protein
MRITLTASLMLATCVANASASETVTRTTPVTTFSTTRTADAFARCVLDAVRPGFPASTATKVATGQTITIANAEGVAAVVEVSEPFRGDGGLVLVRSPAARQPGKDPIVQSARHCQ